MKEVLKFFIVKPNLYFNKIYIFLINEYNIYVSKETV